MDLIELRKYFYNSKNFVIRLREDKDIVYYNGIKVMNINHTKEEETYECIANIYRLNKAFLTSENVKKDLKDKKYEDAKYFQDFLEMRDNLMGKDEFLKIIKNPNIVITRENHSNENTLADEKKVVTKLLKELKDNKLDQYLEFSIKKEYTLEKLSNVSFQDIENLKQELSKIFNLDCKIYYTKRHWKTLQKEKKNGKVKINMQDHNENNYENLKKCNYLDSVKVHFELAKKISVKDFYDNYISLSEFNKNKNAKELFDNDKWKDNFKFNDTIKICLNNDASMEKLLLIELLVLKHWILDEECNYIDTSKIHRKKPESNIINCPKKSIKDLDQTKLEELLGKITNGIKNYELSKYENEKNYQHRFMLDIKAVDKLKNALNINDFVYPFEEEYYTSDSEKDNDIDDDNDTKLGRIDNVFLNIHNDNNIDVYLIELKYNETALGGTNGLHTHLNDIKKLFTKDYSNFDKSLKNVINYHLKTVHKMIPNTKLPKSINKICRYHFLIIIGYEKKQKNTILDILNAYNSVDYYKNTKNYSKIPKPVNKNKCYKTTLKDLCNNIPQDKCDVQLLLDEVKKVKEEEKNKDVIKIQITDKELEKYEIF